MTQTTKHPLKALIMTATKGGFNTSQMNLSTHTGRTTPDTNHRKQIILKQNLQVFLPKSDE